MRNELDWIVMKALEKDRTRRYETANGFAADVQRYLAGEAVLAHPPSTAYRLKKFVRRHRGRVVAASAVFLTLLLGIAGTTTGLIRATSAEGQARHALAQVTEEQVKTQAALDQAREADATSRRRLARQYVDRGGRHLDEGNTAEALPWFAAAWEAEADLIDADREAVHRLRLAATADLAPKPVHVWQHGGDGTVDLQISPDGSRVVSILWLQDKLPASGTVRVWNLESGRSLTSPLPISMSAHSTGRPSGVSMSRDGRRLVTEMSKGRPSDDKEEWTAQVWDADTGQPIGKPLPAGGSGWTTLSPDGSRVLTVVPVYKPFVPVAKGDKNEVIGGEARVWDVATGTPVTPPLTMPGGVGAAAFNADGTRVITTCDTRIFQIPYHEIRMVWDAASGRALTPLLRSAANPRRAENGHLLPADSWTEDATRFLAAEADTPMDQPPRVWDMHSGQPLTPTLPLEDFKGPYATLSPNGDRILFRAGSSNGRFRIADATSGKTVATLTAGAGESPMLSALFSPDGRWVYGTSAALGRERVNANETRDWARVWDARTGTPRTAAVPLDSTLAELKFDAFCGRAIVRDRTAIQTTAGGVRVLAFPTMAAITPPIVHQNRPTTAEFSPGTRQILTRGGTHARVWESSTGVPRTPVLPHPREVTDARFSPDGRFAITACAGGRVYVWPTRTEPGDKPLTPGGRSWQMALDPSGTRLLTASYATLQASRSTGNTLNTERLETRLWDLTTGRSITLDRGVIRPQRASPKFSPDGQWTIAINSRAQGGIDCWYARTLTLASTITSSDYPVRTEFADASTLVIEDGSSRPTVTRAVRLPGGEPVEPVPKARPPKLKFQVLGGATLQVIRPAPLPALTLEPDGGIDDGWANGPLVWTTGRRTALARHELIGYNRDQPVFSIPASLTGGPGFPGV